MKNMIWIILATSGLTACGSQNPTTTRPTNGSNDHGTGVSFSLGAGGNNDHETGVKIHAGAPRHLPAKGCDKAAIAHNCG